MRQVASIKQCRLFSLILASSLSLPLSPGGLAGAADDRPADELAQELKSLADEHAGTVAIAVKHLPSGRSVYVNADQKMPTASLVKFPVMAAAYHLAESKKLDLDQLVELREADKVPGSGILTTHFSAGTSLPLRDVIRLMIVYSDNTATNLVLDRIGLRTTAELMNSLDLPTTRIHSQVFRRGTSVFPAGSQQFGLGVTTARETIRLYEMLHGKNLISESASGQMMKHLIACDDRSKLLRFLPRGTKVAHKSGAVSNARCDAGIVFGPEGPLAICVLTSENTDRSWGDDNGAEIFCGRVAEKCFRYFNPIPVAADPSQSVLQVGASGYLVEALQRTLNDRLQPSPELAVDGDFGPNTRAAVVRFQQEQQLDADGVVRSKTWSKLGTLITRDAPVPDPAEINTRTLERDSADPLEGHPFLTCKAWCVGDAKSGKLLWGDAARQRLDFASTTKVMTAYLVLSLAQDHPEVLDELVVFSPRADATPGSTAGVRAGEQLKVRELLYGLLLPSGNDASVALAEHFGARLAPQHAASEKDPVRQFVAAMNAAAEKLEMSHTSYRNPHGLTADGHQSSAGDLLKLACAAWHLDGFQEYVGTREHGCTVEGQAGYRRNLLWKNTNRLLPIEGYCGMKTGTTRAAGACLVAVGRRGEDELIVVVLGAQSSDARYVDTRNLFRWAWQQRGN